MSPDRTSKRGQGVWHPFGWSAVALGIALALVAAEFGIRGLRLQGDQFFEPDPFLGWVHRKSFRGTYVSPEAVNPAVQVNAHGLLGPDRSYEKPASIRRVVLLGDSYTESMQVPYEETWGHLLERGLGPRWEVINGGVAGYGIDNTYLALRREYGKYDADVLFLMFFTGNDVSDNDSDLYAPDRGSRPKPWFTFDANTGLTLHGSPMPMPEGLVPRVKFSLRQHSHAYRFVKDRITLLRTAEGYSKGTDGGIPRPWYVYCLEPRTDFARAWRTTTALIQAVRAQADSSGAILAAGILPTDWRVEPDQRGAVLARYPAMSDTTKWDFSHPDRLVKRIFERHEIPVVDLSPALIQARAESDSPLYSDHLTAAGHKVVASELSEYFIDVVLPLAALRDSLQ